MLLALISITLRSAIKIQLKRLSLMTTALAGGFFLKFHQNQTGYLNYIVRLTYRRRTKKGEIK